MENFIVFDGNKFDINRITEVTPNSDFQEYCISFIQEWNSGQEYFPQHTSGSTGTPKLIEINRSQMMASAMLTIKALDLKPQTNSLLCLSPDYIAGKMMIVRSLINNMNIVTVEPAASPPITSLNDDIHFAAFTPMQMQNILSENSDRKKIDEYDTIILGGGNIPASLKAKLATLKSNCFSTYGMTETVSHIALKKLNGPDQSNYYTTLDGVEINIDHRECLTIKSAVTNFKTIITNDRVNLVSDHKFEWLGRVDNVINSGGVKIQCEKLESHIETLLAQLQTKNRFFVYGIPDDQLGEKLVLILEGNLSSIKLGELNQKLKEELPKYEVPKDILFIKKFKETPTGKIQRKATVTSI